jgi:hypothetical protein
LSELSFARGWRFIGERDACIQRDAGDPERHYAWRQTTEERGGQSGAEEGELH